MNTIRGLWSIFRTWIVRTLNFVTHESAVRLVTLGGFVVGAAALVSSAKQSADTNQLTREMNIDSMWTGYMELAMANPEFAEGVEFQSLNEKEQIRYMWMFERLAYTAESIEILYPNDPVWRSVFTIELEKHRSLIENHPRFIADYFCDYDPPVRAMISSFSPPAQSRNQQCLALDSEREQPDA